MSEVRFRNKVAALAGVAAAELSDATSIDVSEWDSVEVLELISLIDESFDVTVPGNELNSCRSFGELRRLIDAAGNKS